MGVERRGTEASMKQRDDEPLRSWIHRVLTDDPTKSGYATSRANCAGC